MRPPLRSANAVEALIEAYKQAPEWSQLSLSTRANWELYLKRIAAAWGPLEVRGVEPKHVLALRDKYAATPAAANNLLRCLSSLLSWSVPRGGVRTILVCLCQNLKAAKDMNRGPGT